MKEFLQFYSMDYSNSVFSSESNKREEVTRSSLASEINIPNADKE